MTTKDNEDQPMKEDLDEDQTKIVKEVYEAHQESLDENDKVKGLRHHDLLKAIGVLKLKAGWEHIEIPDEDQMEIIKRNEVQVEIIDKVRQVYYKLDDFQVVTATLQ